LFAALNKIEALWVFKTCSSAIISP